MSEKVLRFFMQAMKTDAEEQADSRLCWMHVIKVHFLMLRLKYCCSFQLRNYSHKT